MTYSDDALAAMLDAKADQLREDKHAPEVALELATLLGDMDEIAVTAGDLTDAGQATFETATESDGIALFVPKDIAAMTCDECGGETQTYVHTESGLALCPDCRDE